MSHNQPSINYNPMHLYKQEYKMPEPLFPKQQSLSNEKRYDYLSESLKKLAHESDLLLKHSLKNENMTR
jgi:hypothetical protein